jgi:hypothetical protein
MTTILVASGLGWLGWRYWRRYEREKQRQVDAEFWARVRRECPSCATRREQRAQSATC